MLQIAWWNSRLTWDHSFGHKVEEVHHLRCMATSTKWFYCWNHSVLFFYSIYSKLNWIELNCSGYSLTPILPDDSYNFSLHPEYRNKIGQAAPDDTITWPNIEPPFCHKVAEVPILPKQRCVFSKKLGSGGLDIFQPRTCSWLLLILMSLDILRCRAAERPGVGYVV